MYFAYPEKPVGFTKGLGVGVPGTVLRSEDTAESTRLHLLSRADGLSSQARLLIGIINSTEM